MPDRIKCIIPFCKRTASAEKFAGSDEIICGKCWRYVTPATKRHRQLLKRRSKRIDRLLMRRAILSRPGCAEQMGRLEELFGLAHAKNWERCKQEAIGNRAGIGG